MKISSEITVAERADTDRVRGVAQTEPVTTAVMTFRKCGPVETTRDDVLRRHQLT